MRPNPARPAPDDAARASGPPADSMTPQARNDLALFAALATVVVWGANFSIQKTLFDTLGPGGFLWGRYVVMPLCAVALVLWRYGPRLPPVSRRDLWSLAWLGVVGHFVHVGMVVWGIHWSTAFSSSLILACGPLFSLVILRVMGVERLGRAQVAGVAIACAGVLVFLSEKLLGADWRATGGDLFLLLASSVFAYYTVMAKPLMERLGAVPVMIYATLLGSLPVIVVALPLGLRAPWGELSTTGWALFFWSVVISAFVGWLVWGWANAARGVARTAPLQYLMPPIAGLIAWSFHGERFDAIKIAGAALTLAGVAVAQFAGGRPRESPAMVD
jgi:drug/metabolite transporter (DMT)-like permease